MATFTIAGFTVTLAPYQWSYSGGRQFGSRNEGVSDYGVLHRDLTGTIQRKMLVRFTQIDSKIEALRMLSMKAGRNGLPVTFTDEDGSTWVTDWPDAVEFQQILENRRAFEVPLIERLGVVPLLPPTALLPAGTIMVGGFGDAGTCRFLSANGAVSYPQPASAPVPGTGMSAFCRLSTGDIAQVGGNAPTFPTTGAGVWKASDLTKLSEYIGDRDNGTCCASDALGFWYTTRVSSAGATIRQFARLNAASAEVATWDITIPTGFDTTRSAAMAVSDDGLTAYCWLMKAFPDADYGKRRIYKFDLTGSGTYVGLLHADYGSPPGYGSLLCVPGSGDLLVAFNNLNGATVGPIKRYTPGGSVVWTSGAPAGAGGIDWEGLALGLPGDTHFLAWCYDNLAATSSGARYVWFNYATGVPDNTRNFTPADGSFEFDSQFVVLAQGIVA
jgi:hypothetical protein